MSDAVVENSLIPIIGSVTAAQSAGRTVDQALKEMMESSSGRMNVNAKVDVQEVKIYPTHVEVEMKGVMKAISFVDFKQLLDSQLQLESKMEMMALPYHCYMLSKSTSEIHLACYYPEQRLELKHLTRKFPKCLMPNVVITHKLKHDNGFWLVKDSHFFCTDKKPTELPEGKMLDLTDSKGAANGIWLMPFPNFYNDGRMCYGGNTMPVKFGCNLRGLDYYYQVISISPFNNDLGLRVRKYAADIPGWFEFLAKAETFPYDILGNDAY